MVCEKCGFELTADRGCQEVLLRCPSCGKSYELKKYASRMDDEFEEEMGFVPMDRI
uniref:dual CXXC motif small (seleno)protein n=1 Tax=Pseudodesulfovibrio piezophilus TaxID=879567 RepID=UPI0022B226A1|nr:dual CXXC motif small (seleno)protein [Pseudodesulfovibrio piezophilus]